MTLERLLDKLEWMDGEEEEQLQEEGFEEDYEDFLNGEDD